LTEDREVGHEDLKVPEYAAAKRTPREVILGRVSEDPTPEQRTALARIETALHTYLSYFYPHDARE
jgi:hypothetical protein